MAGLVEQRFKGAVRRVFQSMNLDIRRPIGTLSDIRLKLLKACAVTVLIDGGANIGQFARSVRKDGYPGRIISFEPVPDAYAILARSARRDLRWQVHNLALGKSDGTVRMNISGDSVSSSALVATDTLVHASPRSAPRATVTATARRLDTLRDLVKPSDRIWLKLDVQGQEKEVLEGARHTLRQTEAVEAELSLTPLYRDQDLFYEVSRLLYAEGYVCVFIEPEFVDPRSGYMLQVNAIFLRSRVLSR